MFVYECRKPEGLYVLVPELIITAGTPIEITAQHNHQPRRETLESIRERSRNQRIDAPQLTGIHGVMLLGITYHALGILPHCTEAV